MLLNLRKQTKYQEIIRDMGNKKGNLEKRNFKTNKGEENN